MPQARGSEGRFLRTQAWGRGADRHGRFRVTAGARDQLHHRALTRHWRSGRDSEALSVLAHLTVLS